eukprot:TRINITY_DN1616_c1_g1_i1.p1 TRINITY_DN1616_c1_g1~~TRINITY_DN1616_c1_g1_i1.p1  ORF type:complete len:294 (-),score=53.83 TRINITY_DN1616_c1_g1_i1:201-980(-)
MSGLGPAPRMTGIGGGDNLQFYSPPGSVQTPGSFGAPGAAGSIGGVQPPQAVVPPGPMQPGNFPSAPQAPGIFPQPSASPSGYTDIDVDNEPPLLEELGINIEHIIMRIQGVAFFKKLDEDVLRDADLSGPLAIVLALALCLLLTGKLAFGYVYGFGATGCVGVCMLINMMSQKSGIDLYRTMSILGYGLIPIVFLALIGVFVSLKSGFGTVVSAICILWATATSSRFFATAISMHQQRWLVAYPVGLVYTCFTLLTVF